MDRSAKWIATVGLFLAVLVMASPALADDYVGTPAPNVAAQDPGAGARPVAVLSASGVRAAPAGTLALTGADIVSMVFLALVSVGAGVIVVRRTRRVRA